MNEELQQWVQGWFDKGEHDLRAADVILHSENAFASAMRFREFIRNKLGFNDENSSI